MTLALPGLRDLLREQFAMMQQEAGFLWPERVHAPRRIDRPPIEYVGWQGRVHMHRAIVLEGDQAVIEQGVHMRREQDAVAIRSCLGRDQDRLAGE